MSKEVSIGDFAESLMQEGNVGEHVPQVNDPFDVDLSKIDGDLIREEVLNGELPTIEKLVAENSVLEPTNVEQVETPENILTESQASKLSRLSGLLKEAAELIDEMTGAVGMGTTTTGCIGTNMAGPTLDPQKPKKIKRKKKPARKSKNRSIEDIIKESLQ